jgi:hypothetical protein
MQVSRCIGLSGSDREFPALTGRSGTQRARRMRSCTTAGTSAPWSSAPPSDPRITSAFHVLVAGLNSAFTLGSQGADGGDRWLLMAPRGTRTRGAYPGGAQDWPVLAGTPGGACSVRHRRPGPARSGRSGRPRSLQLSAGTSGLPDTGLNALPRAARMPYCTLSGETPEWYEAE